MNQQEQIEEPNIAIGCIGMVVLFLTPALLIKILGFQDDNVGSLLVVISWFVLFTIGIYLFESQKKKNRELIKTELRDINSEPINIKQVEKIAKKHCDYSHIFVFGSFARGGHYNDIDILVLSKYKDIFHKNVEIKHKRIESSSGTNSYGEYVTLEYVMYTNQPYHFTFANIDDFKANMDKEGTFEYSVKKDAIMLYPQFDIKMTKVSEFNT